MKYYIYTGISRLDALSEDNSDRVSILNIGRVPFSDDYITTHSLTEHTYDGSENTITFEFDEDQNIVEVTEAMIMDRMNNGELPD